nr:hypothetical protein [Tanacetum cinerariifolium]
MMSLFKSDSKFSVVFSQFESAGASGSSGSSGSGGSGGSSGCGDDEESADDQKDGDEDGDGDRKITLRVGEEKLIFKRVKPASSLIKRVYMLSLRERMELDLEARLMGETLLLNRSLDPFFRDYIELNDLNVPLDLRRDQVDDLMPTIKEGEVIEEFRARNNARMVRIFFGYPSNFDNDKKIRIDYAYNLKFSCMIDFAVLEDMDAYRDEGMGDVIFGQPFLREVRINAKRFKGMITIHNGNEEVTYQMVWSHPLFKHHTSEQCNKIPPLMKNEESSKELSGVIMIVKMVKLH